MSEPVIAQKMPYVLDETARRVAWCQCGKSANQPYCDGSHAGTGFSPVLVEITEDKKIVWCGCKHTANPPYCDGRHKNL